MSEGKSDAPLMVGVSGLRGIVGESLTPEVAMRFAGAFGTWLRDTEGPLTCILANDGRENAEAVHLAVKSALLWSGITVIDIGTAMTPTVATAADAESAAAIQITASHNPREWCGIKLLLGPNTALDHRTREQQGDEEPCAAAPSSAIAREIIDRYEARQIRWFWTEFVKRSTPGRAIHHDYHETLVSMWWPKTYGVELAPQYNVVLDSVNASGARAAESLLRARRHHVVQLHGDNSGIFPHTPEPTAENLSGEGGLCDAVPGLKADVGFAQDPDGDRLAIVDETGRYIGEEYTLALCAVSILEARAANEEQSRGREHAGRGDQGTKGTPSDAAGAGPPPPRGAGEDADEVVLCANLSTSRMVDDIAARYGASVVRTAVGEANVVEAMKRLKREGKTVVLGGEGNGGVIWPEVTYVRDSLGSMALVLSLMARTGKTVSELVAAIPSYAIVKRKQPLANKSDAQPAIERIATHYASERVDTQDGVRVDFDSKKAWVHVRASNTEPILRLIAEVEDEAVANAILDEVATIVNG